MFGLSKLRIVEIGVALLLTLAALIFVGLTVWAAETARLEIAGAWARPTVGQTKVSAAYMTIANKGADGDRLTGARTPKAEAVELHQTTMTADGVVRMLEILEDEVHRALAGCGVTGFGELGKSHLHAAQPVTAPHVFSAFPLLDIASYKY